MSTYVVMPGESLTTIAKAHSTTSKNLVTLNGLSADLASAIRPGQILRLR